MDTQAIDYSIKFFSIDDYRLGFEAEADGADSAELGTNYLSMKYGSDNLESFYGMGLQYTDWDFKGKQVPLITTEAGVGKGLQPITAALNIFASGGGGDDVTAYAPAAQYITNRNRGMIFDQLKIGYADF